MLGSQHSSENADKKEMQATYHTCVRGDFLAVSETVSQNCASFASLLEAKNILGERDGFVEENYYISLFMYSFRGREPSGIIGKRYWKKFLWTRGKKKEFSKLVFWAQDIYKPLFPKGDRAAMVLYMVERSLICFNFLLLSLVFLALCLHFIWFGGHTEELTSYSLNSPFLVRIIPRQSCGRWEEMAWVKF